MKTPLSLSSFTPTEPDPRTWLTDERRQQLTAKIGSAQPLLLQAGLWRATLCYWVREQASLEAKWDYEEEQNYLDKLERKWGEKKKDRISSLDPNLLRAKLRVGPAANRWSREQWGHRLDFLYLQAKSQLDRASCRLIRISSKALASELYHRIKAGETSFDAAAREFGEGPEREQGGLISMMPLGSMPFGLAPVLEHLKPSKISQPMRLGKGFCLVELIEFKVSQLDQATGDLLLADQLRGWIDSVVDVLEADLS